MPSDNSIHYTFKDFFFSEKIDLLREYFCLFSIMNRERKKEMIAGNPLTQPDDMYLSGRVLMFRVLEYFVLSNK